MQERSTIAALKSLSSEYFHALRLRKPACLKAMRFAYPQVQSAQISAFSPRVSKGNGNAVRGEGA
jgi:hypothetical protein